MKRINVTQSFLPPIDEYETYLKDIWKTRILTNQGSLVRSFESDIKKYLNIDDFHFVNNGTSALQIALRALGITEGEIITTPFTYVATTSAILWERCKPVFVDIEPHTFCIDASKIEAAITKDTKAILAVHVFGFPCDVEAIELIAKKHDIKVIYDGAHAFGVVHKGKSLLSYGDVSTCSFHATKPFHTVEGGAIIAAEKSVSDVVDLTIRFGHNNDDHFMLGINAKASELHAAMGLCNLKYIDEILEGRKKAFDLYNVVLSDNLRKPSVPPYTEHNYPYYPVVFEDEATLKKVVEALNEQNVYPRRYFYPSLNTLPYLDDAYLCPISESTASRTLCLPLYTAIEERDVRMISEIVNTCIG